MYNKENTPLKPLKVQQISYNACRLAVLRLDQNHPQISGNKYYKLLFNIDCARALGKSGLLSFGGAYSNHIHAMAYAARENGLKAIGVIRGERQENLNPTLKDVQAWGMQLVYMDRESYRTKTDDAVLAKLQKQYPDYYVIPEGGSNDLALQGCMRINDHISETYHTICVAAGTGITAAGIIEGMSRNQQLLAFAVLKGDFLERQTGHWLNKGKRKNWRLITDYHFGGYAKWKPELIAFIRDFRLQTGITLDPVYTAKLAFGIVDMLEKELLPNNGKTIMIHSGGLQGIRGFEERFQLKL